LARSAPFAHAGIGRRWADGLRVLEGIAAVSTFVLVHGGGHGGWCYRSVARILRSQGHEVYAPSMTGLGERSHLLRPDIDLDMHIHDIVAVLHYEDLRDVILVGHSYGGMVITGVADRTTDRVGRLVYLDAATPVNGQSLLDVAGPIIEATRPLGKVVDGVELVLLPGAEAGRFYGVEDPVDLAWMDGRLAGHPWKCFEQRLELTNEDALWAIPQYHIVCTSTLATRDPEQMATARAEGRLWDIDTGHDLMITEPERVAAALSEVAAA
jgi:pimeloyl-ACP methyl ester carboxylesterase